MRHLLFFAFLLCCACSVFGQNSTDNALSQPFPFKVNLITTDGGTYPSATVLGKEKKVTVIAFWLTTCMPCMVELETYKQQYASWKQQADFNMFAFSIDFEQNYPNVKRVVAEKQWPFPAYWDRERAFKDILPGGLNGLPQVFVFNTKGELVYRHKGFKSGDEKELFEQIKKAK